MSLIDVNFLSIEAYSDHPEVYAVAGILTSVYFDDRPRKRNPNLVAREETSVDD